MSDSNMVYSLSRDYVVDTKGEEVVAIMKLATGQVFKVENSGKEILFWFIHGRTLEEVVSHLCESYAVERSLVLHDVQSILEHFLTIGLLTRGQR